MAKSVKINGVTYSDVPQVEIPLSTGSGNATFYETSADDVAAADVLAGKSYHGASGGSSGTMTNNGAVTGTIATKAGTYTIPAGYHSGGGSVGISSTEQAKIIAGNIRSGVTILGIAGSSSVVDTSDATAAAARILTGYTAYVNGAKVTGTMTAASVSQDSTSKVLSIA